MKKFVNVLVQQGEKPVSITGLITAFLGGIITAILLYSLIL